MDPNALREQGKRMLDFVAEHWETQRERRTAVPPVQPGYLKGLLPTEAPSYPEEWKDIFNDLEKAVMEGTTNWHHPHFHAYYATACSYPAIVADILSGGLAAVGFSWQACPSMTELEQAVLDWLVRSLGLPEHFLNSHDGPGCGIIQNTASDATYVALLAARARAIEDIKENSPSFRGWAEHALESESLLSTITAISAKLHHNDEEMAKYGDDYVHPHFHDPSVFEKFVAYTADQANSSVEKDVLLCGVKLRKLRTTKESLLGNYTVTAETLEAAIKEDRARGLIPFVFVATMGYTTTCGVDFVKDVGPVCNRERLWLHVDAAYAGSYLICPEFRELLGTGMETVDSFNFNAHKTLMTNFDCSPMWFKDGQRASKFFSIDPIYLKHVDGGTDYRNLQIALGRRFRSLKLWFVLRAIGVAGLQDNLRTMNARAEQFASLVSQDDDFELFVPYFLGLVCFRMANSTDEQNELLMESISSDGRLYLVPGHAEGVFYLRFAVCTTNTTEDDVRFAFKLIKELAQPILQNDVNKSS